MTDDRKDTEDRTWTEEIEVSSDRLMDKIKELANEASVRRVRIKEPDGDIAVDLPLTVGALAGGALVLAAPMLALIGALVAFFTKVKLEVVRDATEEAQEPETTEVD
ncbi:DUF4342 domain-containing protein [Psychromarinibacter sp. C21-152]|uniref:DUF4342 domain-containing protein n=1 Tax=Psychromarinibacter sediminicola TaxID=3033385 RepID=A0AAE3T7N1_9RHOB|nr:DUF4342 domain-containing protein [Psychromarinibacter sediminicola]MDF0599888.1 DUF4342 domain-containing protein [Psychromarinibacter sediminicola]